MIPAINITDILSNDHNFQSIMRNMLQTTLDQCFDGVMITEAGPGYPIVYVNSAFCEMTGYKIHDLLGKSPSMLQGKKTDQRVLDDLKKKIEIGDVFHGKTMNYRKDGTEFIMEWKIVPVRNKHEEISHYLAIQREIDEDKLEFKPMGSKLPFGP